MKPVAYDTAVSFKAPQGFIAKLRAEAARNDMSVSEFLRHAVRRQIETAERQEAE